MHDHTVRGMVEYVERSQWDADQLYIAGRAQVLQFRNDTPYPGDLYRGLCRLQAGYRADALDGDGYSPLVAAYIAGHVDGAFQILAEERHGDSL